MGAFLAALGAVLLFVLKAVGILLLVVLALVVLLAATMFTNLKFIHPVRTERWRPLSLGMALGWVGFATWAAWVDFHPQSLAHLGLLVTSVYLLGAGIVQEIWPERPATRA